MSKPALLNPNLSPLEPMIAALEALLGRLPRCGWSGSRSVWLRLCVLLVGSFLISYPSAAVDESQLPPAIRRPVDFAQDIQPILTEHCLECHGSNKQKGGFRLDDRDSALKGGETYSPAIQPKDSAHSPLIHLVAGLVPDTRMPAKGPALTAEQVGLLRAWIDQGAIWPETATREDPITSHWSFRPVQRPAVPVAKIQGRNPVDAFVSSRLATQQLSLSPEADRVTLLRRLSLVLVGVPPTPSEMAAFLADPKAGAFERQVDRLLEDPRYGERWARHWLDIIRFAESNGFETNRERPNAWRFRDYVIASFNDDKPYDRFVQEQLAGDVLGVDVGTGFLVGGPVDIVRSPDPVLTAQQRADELDDMVNTTGTAFLGLTLGCARCHSHKFDPIAHREYYALSAVFSGVQHGDRAQPLSAEQQARLADCDRQMRQLEEKLSRFIAKPKVESEKTRPAVQSRQNEDVIEPVETRALRFTILASSSGEPCIDELEVWSGNRNVALSSAGTKATASGTLPGYEIHKLEHLNDGRVGNDRSWISNESGRGWVQLEFAKPERIDRIVWGRDREGRFQDRVITDYRIEVALEPGRWRRVSGSEGRQPFQGAKPTPAGPEYDFQSFSKAEADQGRAWLADWEKLKAQRPELAKPVSFYAGTFSQPGPTHRLHRGDPMQKRETVAPGTLAVFRPFALPAETSEKERRFQLARWITDPSNPLTARVIINRLWQHHFGVGFVDTPNDFGRNGSKPTHPELLDWLASELVHPTLASGGGAPQPWSLKRIHRLILTSAAWRQSSAPREDAMKVDASSRLLWRFPPRRLEAEAIRDSILAVSGNLDLTRGGPSFFLHQVDRENVYHYHPKEDFGPEDTRRMVYAFKVRMEQDGIFGAFDCPDGSLVVPRRSLSTTPLQALNLFNSRFILKQSETFAERLHREAGDPLSAQVRRAWQLAYSRLPNRIEEKEALVFARAEGVPALCRVLLNSNEFLFIP